MGSNSKKVGIETINVFGGTVYLDVLELAKHRNLDTHRFDNLLMKEKTVALPYEDPVTFAVNAAKPIVDSLSVEEKNRIELLIICTESGIDFGKSVSTYVHNYLDLNRNCRLFEIKQACYSGTAGLQMAINTILANCSPGAKALVITTDISRFIAVSGGEKLTEDWSYAEPSSGAGAVAMLVSDKPDIFRIEIGANGYYGFEIMDTCRPVPEGDAGNADLSLMAYLDCCEKTFIEFQQRVKGVDYRHTFHFLAFHTPFGGMVKGAHRSMMRKLTQTNKNEVERDFDLRVLPGLDYCQRVGNIMGGTVYLSLVSIIDNAKLDSAKRVGCFSYGSGCCSEFFSGVITPQSQKKLQAYNIKESLDKRHQLSMENYEELLRNSELVKFGTKNVDLTKHIDSDEWMKSRGELRLYMKSINDFHREYDWI